MGGIRAVWHSELELADDDDPFGEPQRIEDVGTAITIGAEGEEAQLQRELVVSLLTEGVLDADGVRCAIKDARDTSCFACPLHRDDGSPAAQLCAVGRKQERLCTRIAVVRRGGQR